MRALLDQVARRLRVAWGVATGHVVFPVVALAAVGLVVLGFLAPWWWPEPLAVAVAVGAAAALAVRALTLRVPARVAARAADRGLATGDSFSTALEVATTPDDGLHPWVLRRAESLAAGVHASDAVPLRWRRRPLAAGGLLTVAAIGLAVLPNHQDEVRAQRAAEHAAIDATAADLAEQAAEIAEQPELTGAEAALAEELARLAEELEQSGSLAEAEQLLAEAQAELAAQVSAGLESQRAAATGLQRSLEAAPLPGTDATAAAEQLAEAAEGVGELTAEEQAALAEQLEALAEGQRVANPALAEALAEAAAALGAGDTAGAQAALGEAAAAAGEAVSDVAAQDAAAEGAARVGDAAGQLGEGRSGGGEATREARPGDELIGRPCPDQDELDEANAAREERGQPPLECVGGQVQAAGAGAGADRGAGQGNGSGNGNGSGQGNGNGNGSGQGTGAGSGASGAVGGSSAAGGSGRGGVGTPSGSGNNPSEGLDLTGDEATVYVPGEDLAADTANGGGDPGETVGRGDTASGQGSVRVPAGQVLAGYERRATASLERAGAPPSVRALVRAYFDALSGRNQG